MCGCKRHAQKEAPCDCICPEHQNFALVRKLLQDEWRKSTKLQTLDTLAAEAGRKAELEHQWNATTRLCACGEFFNATLDGNHAHDRHRLVMAYAAIKEAQLS
jgi:hypothetical protein